MPVLVEFWGCLADGRTNWTSRFPPSSDPSVGTDPLPIRFRIRCPTTRRFFPLLLSIPPKNFMHSTRSLDLFFAELDVSILYRPAHAFLSLYHTFSLFLGLASRIRLTIITGVPTNISSTPSGLHSVILSAMYRIPFIDRRVAETVNLLPARGNGFSGAPLQQVPQLSHALTTKLHGSEI